MKNCDWEGTVGTLEEHLATCEFTRVFCPQKCKDDNNKITHFMRKDLNKHLENDCPNRDHKCEHCGEKGTYAHITQVHDNICERKILPCPNADCTKTIQRRNTVGHLDRCVYTKIPCKYQRLGCDVKMMRKDMRAHEEDDKLHLHMALDKVISMEQEMKDMNTVINDSKSKLQEMKFELNSTLKNGQAFTFKVTNIQQRRNNNEKFTSPSFYTSPGGYHMAIQVYPNGYDAGNGTHVTISALIKGGKYDTELRWPFVGKVTITLLNQLKDGNHKSSVSSNAAADNTRVGSACCFTDFISHFELAIVSRNTQYLKDDTLYFRVSVQVSDHKPWLECPTKRV